MDAHATATWWSTVVLPTQSYRGHGSQTTRQQNQKGPSEVILRDGRRQHCGERRSGNVDHVNSRWVTIEASDLPSGQRQPRTWVSLEDGEELRTIL